MSTSDDTAAGDDPASAAATPLGITPADPSGAPTDLFHEAIGRHPTALGRHLDNYLAAVARELQANGVLVGAPQRSDPAHQLIGSSSWTARRCAWPPGHPRTRPPQPGRSVAPCIPNAPHPSSRPGTRTPAGASGCTRPHPLLAAPSAPRPAPRGPRGRRLRRRPGPGSPPRRHPPHHPARGRPPRYRQEFLAELHALAEEQASRRAQLGHALRAAAGMWSLRRAVRAPRPGRGGFASATMGSVSLHCVLHAARPVTVVRPSPQPADGND